MHAGGGEVKTVFVCFYEAYPPTSGAAVVTYNAARHVGGDVTLLQVTAEDRNDAAGGVVVRSIGDNVSSKWRKVIGLRRRIGRLTQAIRALEPDVMVLEGASWVVFHWLLLKRVREALPNVRIVFHSHNVEYDLRRQKHGRAVRALTYWAEKLLLKNADVAFACSAVDAQRYQQLYGVKVDVMPNGVDVAAFDAVTPADVGRIRTGYDLSGPMILFMGSYAYKPNREALDFLVESVMPGVFEAIPSARLVVTGGDMPLARPWLKCLGMLPSEDIAPLVRAADIGVASIFSGSGTRLKILEYLAAGLAVVSTRKGAEGLAVNDGESILFAEDAAGFIRGVVELLRDSTRAKALGQAGKELVRRQYGWPGIMERCRPELFGHVSPVEAKVLRD